jgi:hypothetical protein
MPIQHGEPESRLHGITIFLSASVPSPERADEYERIEEAPLRIEEAVVSIARAIFVEGGTLVFGAHPSISPLVARVADHYYLPAPAEETNERRPQEIKWKNPSVIIYQSQVWQPYWAKITEQLSLHPLVNIRWTPVENDETVDPAVKDRPQAPLSMERMRSDMIRDTSPIAMIAIGGMKGVLDEAGTFRDLRPGNPIFTLATTGGAAAILARRFGEEHPTRVADRNAEALVRSFWQSQEEPDLRERFREESARTFYVPYAVVAQQLVADIIESYGTEMSV